MGQHKRKTPWTRRAEGGERAWKQVVFRVVPPEGHPDLDGKIVQRAPAGQCYTQAHVEEIIERMVDRLDARFPHWEFRMVKVGECQYNFVYAGLRAVTPMPEHGINDEEYPL